MEYIIRVLSGFASIALFAAVLDGTALHEIGTAGASLLVAFFVWVAAGFWQD